MKKILSFVIALCLCAAAAWGYLTRKPAPSVSADDLPAYSGALWVDVEGTQPGLSDINGETFTPLDGLGRCGPASALVGPETMPDAPREGIGMIRPSGWQLAKYDFVDGKYLFNRCHLIGYQLTGQNANELNLITGTRYLNVEGMLPFENRVADYVKNTGHHVRYRVTPVFEGDNLVASGVWMEAESVEDDVLSFSVYVYNVQPGVVIDYATGESYAEGEEPAETPAGEPAEAPLEEPAGEAAEVTYILNVNSHKFHLPDCSGAADIKPQNRREFTGTREEAIARGYSPCGQCKP